MLLTIVAPSLFDFRGTINFCVGFVIVVCCIITVDSLDAAAAASLARFFSNNASRALLLKSILESFVERDIEL